MRHQGASSRRLTRLLALGFLLSIASASFAQDAVPIEILNRTIYIRTPAGSGTAFKIDRQGKVYLVTARHMVTGVPATGATIQVRTSGVWGNYKITKIVFPKSADVDIAVMGTGETVAQPYAIAVASGDEGPTFGQTVWFLGYPLEDGLSIRTKGGDFPFIKRGAISAVDATNPDAVLWYVDGMNNHGFSGGPIVYWDFKTHAYKILAVVEGFRYEAADANVDGVTGRSNVLLNSGILVSYSIQHAIDAIDATLKKQ